jgi:hypothetical protein
MIPAAMGRVGCALVTLILAVPAGGCDRDSAPSSEARPPATPTATPKRESAASPVAYRLKTTAARALAGTQAARVIERRGRVVARSTWDGYQAVVLSEWLQRRHVRLGVPRDLRSVVRRVAGEQELSLLVVASEHRRYADALAALHPSERELRAFYERFSGEQSAEAGEAMLDWLRVFRVALRNADLDHVVIIPVSD